MNSLPPLAERCRPKLLSQYVGQKHLLSENGLLSPMLKNGALPSMIFWGPPGVGKTTLARLIAKESKREFHALSAIHSGVKDVSDAIAKAEDRSLFQKGKPILFIDEIHRFSKSQQDSLLAAVEAGTISLFGATTENPGFEVIPALLSRCQVFILQPLKEDELIEIGNNALLKDEYLAPKEYKIEDWDPIIRVADGDARRLLNIIELLANRQEEGSFLIKADLDSLLEANPILYDRKGDQHYDIVSAFIKSIRGSDPQATVYWLARMIEGGEDPKFIARRMLISAAEDIGLANPNALLIANACFDSVEKIGMPEGRIVLSQCALYLATSAKSNSAYLAIDKALALVKETGRKEVPLHLRNPANKLLKSIGHGKGYVYPHSYTGHFKAQEYMPKDLEGSILYETADNPKEESISKQLQWWWSGKYKSR